MDSKRWRAVGFCVSSGLAFAFELIYHPTLRNDTRNLTVTALVFLTAVISWCKMVESSPGYIDTLSDVTETHSQHKTFGLRFIPRSVREWLRTWNYPRLKENSVMVNSTSDIEEFHADISDDDVESNTGLINTSISSRKTEDTKRHCCSLSLERSHHCRTCDRCVATFDHHCDILGICIGEKNRVQFYFFLWIESLCAYIHSCFLRECLVFRKDTFEYLESNAMVLSILLTLNILIFNTTILAIAHTYLIAFNRTTYDILRDESHGVGYSDGCIINIIKFYFCYSQNVLEYSSSWRPIVWRKHQNWRKNRILVACHNLCFNEYYECF